MINKIRAMHQYAFRSGEWAVLVGLEVRKIRSFTAEVTRLCFLVVFPDGKTDAWPVYDQDAQYEFDVVEAGS